jgi:hypothetical protein
MSGTRLDLPSLLVEAKINDIKRQAEHWKLVDEMRSSLEHNRQPRLAMLTTQARGWLTRLTFFWRRAELTARERAARPKTRSQTMQIPSGSA